MNQPFLEHVHELRRRLSVSVAALFIGAAVGYLLHDSILAWLQAPLNGVLYYNQVMGAFEFVMQACLLVGVLVGIPVVVYNAVAFVRPALPRPVSRRQVITLVLISCVLTASGALFAYYVSLPIVLRFLSSIAVAHLHPLIAANSYLSFVISYLAVFALIFQLPLVMLFIDRIRPIPPAKLSKGRKWVVVGAFGAALILPIAPDPVSQFNLALPIVVLYEVSLWLVVLRHRHNNRAARALTPASTPTTAPAPSLAGIRNFRTRQSVQCTVAVFDQLFESRPPVIDLRQSQ